MARNRIDNPLAGFTLIELSIVLVIIGLIVGGVLVGQDLIRAAEIRATVGQIEKYNAAVNTFLSKYNGVPGDLTAADAAAFGLFAETGGSAGTAGHQDGNGILEGGSGGAVVGIGETVEFWRHLTDANLIDGSYGVSGNSTLAAGTGMATGDVTTIGQTLPPAKLGRNNYVAVYSVNGTNYYQIAPFSGLTAGTGAYGLTGSGMTPVEAYNIDSKLDDGLPNSGNVIARSITVLGTTVAIGLGSFSGGGMPSVSAFNTPGDCTVGAGSTHDAYNRNSGLGGTDPSCSLRFRFN